MSLHDSLNTALARLRGDRAFATDFAALCDFGGRQAGTTSETRALDWAHARMREIGALVGATVQVQPTPYVSWRAHRVSIALDSGEAVAANALLGTQATPRDGLTAEIIDLGRGALADFEREGDRLRGRIALVRHEYPFAVQTIHRRKKLGWAMERGACAFVIANPDEGGVVCGSSGRAGGAGIPALATDAPGARRLARAAQAGEQVRIDLDGEDFAAITRTLILDIPGHGADRVVLSAHVDGHDLAESAMDNATGVVAALAVTRALAPIVASAARGLRLCLFSAEEWALAGSRVYLAAMPAAEREQLRLNVNLDTVAGDGTLTALISDFPALDSFINAALAPINERVATHLPLMPNSDHANFAAHGIPAMRLVAGFDNAASSIARILTPGDTRDRVAEHDLGRAAEIAAAIAWHGLSGTDATLTALTSRTL